MDSLNSELGVKDGKIHINQKLKTIDPNVPCNSFNAAISNKRKGKSLVEEETSSSVESNWPSCKKMKSASNSSQFCIEGKPTYSRGHSESPSSGLCEGGRHVAPALHLMVNTDFIVTSPLKQDLMLTLALIHRERDLEKLIFVGYFRAFLSFRNFGLGPDALRIRTESNAGGTSTISEALSVEYFVRRFQAKEIVTEMEVEYSHLNWKKVDYICTLNGQRVGVSVTRAMSYPDPDHFSPDMANRLLHKKLFGLVVARDGVADRHCFSQCILHVWCETERTAKLLQAEYADVSQELEVTDDVIMVLTVADGLHAKPIFYEYCLN
ncbi:uncharacterized protein LOC131035699 [Cryptomeria japonica]|uniref:uncharacterized protein LOC131035699 n=1 Tax=Cryptomeria japonica TaxID=3369 RepID=UPI0025ACEF70|nr:uncharacterized protein LOC131035699 [Cryptomeria japonica]